MDIASPFVVVPVIIAVFFACIFFATSSKEDKSEAGDAMHFDNKHIH